MALSKIYRAKFKELMKSSDLLEKIEPLVWTVQVLKGGSGLVMFMVKPSGQRRYCPLTVSAEEFIRRFLQHMLPTSFQKVRHFGFMHQRSKVSMTWLAMLVTVTLNMVYVLTVGGSAGPAKHVPRCDQCGGQLVYVCHVGPVPDRRVLPS